jgi:hypothetical protein
MYTVTWLPGAEIALANLWNNARNRALIAAAADELDAALARSPTQMGESRGGSLRIAFAKPLGILFDVDDSARSVRV